MTPVNYNLRTQVRGDGFNGVQFTLTDLTNSLPISLVGAAILCQFRKDTKNGNIALQLASGNGITVNDAANGIFTLDPINSLTLGVGIYYYDIETTFDSGVVKTYIEGTFEIVNDVTRV